MFNSVYSAISGMWWGSTNEEPPPVIQKTQAVAEPSLQAAVGNPLSRKLRNLSDSGCNGSVVGVYLFSNEHGIPEVRKTLGAQKAPGNSCHIGFAGLYNFDIMALRRPEWGLMCDFNPHNKQVIDKVLELIKESSTRQEFVAKMVNYLDELERIRFSYVKNDIEKYRQQIQFSQNYNSDYLNDQAEMKGELTREGSWLSNDANFLSIKKLVGEDRISAINLDIRDTARCRKINALFQANMIEIDTLYLSNISGYMAEKEDKKAFSASVHALMTSNTNLINCPVTDSRTPVQRVFKADEFQSSQDDVRFFINGTTKKEQEDQL